MESASANLRCIMEEEEDGEEEEDIGIGPPTLRSGKVAWKEDVRSVVQETEEDKENVPNCSGDAPELSEMRASQLVKRGKKKGFNLRKSLAWNPAFFTEEGVLDTDELSYICGSIGESNRSKKSSNRQILSDAVKNSYSKSQIKSGLQCHSGRKLFITPEPSRRQDKKVTESARKLKQSEPSSKILPRPPTMSQQRRVASMSSTCNKANLQRFIQGTTVPTSRVINKQKTVVTAGENRNGPRCIQSIEEKVPVFPPKSAIGSESGGAPKINSQTIPKAPINASLAIKPSALRKPSPSFGFFAQGNVAAQSSCSSQKSTEKAPTSIPSSLPKAPPSKWRPPIRNTTTKLKTGTLPQSKIPQRMRYDRPVVNTASKKRADKSTITAVEPKEKTVASQTSCNQFSPETCSTKDLDTKIDDSSEQNQCEDSSRAFIEAEEPHEVQHTKNSIAIEACSSVDESAIVSMSGEAISNDTANGPKQMEEDNRICQGPEEIVTTLPEQNSILSETCSLMDVDVIISKSSDVDSKVDSNCKKRALNSYTVSEGQKEEAVVIPSTCSQIPPEICLSEDKHETRNDLNLNSPARCDTRKVSVSPLRTQGGKTDFSPCKEKPVEKRYKLDPRSSLTKRKNNSFEHEIHETGTVQETVTAGSSEGRTIPKFRPDLVPFSEEWLAALVAYGEEILVKKTGPVQNSPPDKTIPEPSPWSPVKKKVQDIGPYDCTKYAKTTPPSDVQ